MNLGSKKKCDRCGRIFPTETYAALCADGEANYASVKIYGERYDLCPECTYKVYRVIMDHNTKSNNIS